MSRPNLLPFFGLAFRTPTTYAARVENNQKRQGMNATSPIIEATNLDKFYGDFHALKDVDLTVYQGQKMVICGPSGSGKSTLIRCFNGLEWHNSGKLVIDGIEVHEHAKEIRALRQEVGMVFQQFNLFPHLTVLENLTIGPMVCQALRKHGVTAPIDVHLMVEPVDRIIPDFAEAGATYISFHPEASRHVHRTIQLIRSLGCKPGIVLNPATPVDILDWVLDDLDLVLLSMDELTEGGLILETDPAVIATRVTMRSGDEMGGMDGGYAGSPMGLDVNPGLQNLAVAFGNVREQLGRALLK